MCTLSISIKKKNTQSVFFPTEPEVDQQKGDPEKSSDNVPEISETPTEQSTEQALIDDPMEKPIAEPVLEPAVEPSVQPAGVEPEGVDPKGVDPEGVDPAVDPKEVPAVETSGEPDKDSIIDLRAGPGPVFQNDTEEEETELVNNSEAFSRNLAEAYAKSMNSFTQNFMAVCWESEGDNFVFSPFSLHSVLAMLTSGSKRNSETELELLDAFGTHRNVEGLEQRYGQFVKNYKTPEVEKNLNFGNRIWTSEKYFPNIKETYQKKIESLYDAKIDLLNPTNPEEEVNDWVKNQTNGEIDKIIGKYKIHPPVQQALILDFFNFDLKI